MAAIKQDEDKYETRRPLVGGVRASSLKAVVYGLKKTRTLVGEVPLPRQFHERVWSKPPVTQHLRHHPAVLFPSMMHRG